MTGAPRWRCWVTGVMGDTACQEQQMEVPKWHDPRKRATLTNKNMFFSYNLLMINGLQGKPARKTRVEALNDLKYSKFSCPETSGSPATRGGTTGVSRSMTESWIYYRQ